MKHVDHLEYEIEDDDAGHCIDEIRGIDETRIVHCRGCGEHRCVTDVWLLDHEYEERAYCWRCVARREAERVAEGLVQ